MLKRIALLCLGLWLIAAGGLSAHAGPCDMEKVQTQVAATEAGHAHCDMMPAAEQPAADNQSMPGHPDTDSPCCCPAVLTALPTVVAPGPADIAFALPSDLPPDARAASRTLIPEPPPPKA